MKEIEGELNMLAYVFLENVGLLWSGEVECGRDTLFSMALLAMHKERVKRDNVNFGVDQDGDFFVDIKSENSETIERISTFPYKVYDSKDLICEAIEFRNPRFLLEVLRRENSISLEDFKYYFENMEK